MSDKLREVNMGDVEKMTTYPHDAKIIKTGLILVPEAEFLHFKMHIHQLEDAMREPKHETVEQWEERTGDTYPDDGPVWCKSGKFRYKSEDRYWEFSKYGDIPEEYTVTYPVIVANHNGKPGDT